MIIIRQMFWSFNVIVFANMVCVIKADFTLVLKCYISDLIFLLFLFLLDKYSNSGCLKPHFA